MKVQVAFFWLGSLVCVVAIMTFAYFWIANVLKFIRDRREERVRREQEWISSNLSSHRDKLNSVAAVLDRRWDGNDLVAKQTK